MSTEWNGKGLPPVGAECEDDAGNRVVIVAHHVNGKHAIFAESLDSGLLYYGAAGELRPILKDEDKAAVAREKAVNEMVQGISKNATGIGFTAAAICAKTLYDLGYRNARQREADTKRLEWMINEGCIVQYQNGTSSPTVFRVYWPSLAEQQPEWYATERGAIDAAMEHKP